MSDVVIRAAGVGKRYALGHHQPYYMLRDVLMKAVTRPRKLIRQAREKLSPAELPDKRSIWALSDVSFEVKRGEVVGIIGRNGAGKTTLLKLLSRVTAPTEGEIEILGRVGSLLEVGTGFHPELTGRENVYLNGAILGMLKSEIDEKFDEIVAFAGIDKFLDTPVKRYSSGMNVRLGFAVAAHLEPSILLVDEVLAVGDMAFRRRCFTKIHELTRMGRTVLFVSHNLVIVQNLCTRCIVLDEGSVSFDGTTADAVNRYQERLSEGTGLQSLARPRKLTGDPRGFRFTGIEVVSTESGELIDPVVTGQDITIRLHYELPGDEVLEEVSVTVACHASTGGLLFATRSDAVGKLMTVRPGAGVLECRLPRCPLNAGFYMLALMAQSPAQVLDRIEQAHSIVVAGGDFYGSGQLPSTQPSVFVDFDWSQPDEPAG